MAPVRCCSTPSLLPSVDEWRLAPIARVESGESGIITHSTPSKLAASPQPWFRGALEEVPEGVPTAL
jgi:cell division protein FtsN